MRLILLPGMGAAGALLDPQRAAFPGLHVPSWLAPNRAETVAEYGARMAVAARSTPDDVVGGVSFGGMVALEMARARGARRVVLISSALDAGEITRLLPAVAALARATRRATAGKRPPRPLLRYACAPIDDASLRFVEPILAAADREHIAWGLSALRRWHPAPLPGAVPIVGIHGERDRMISRRRHGAIQWIANAGHMLSVTHADVVNEFLRAALR